MAYQICVFYFVYLFSLQDNYFVECLHFCIQYRPKHNETVTDRWKRRKTSWQLRCHTGHNNSGQHCADGVFCFFALQAQLLRWHVPIISHCINNSERWRWCQMNACREDQAWWLHTQTCLLTGIQKLKNKSSTFGWIPLPPKKEIRTHLLGWQSKKK